MREPPLHVFSALVGTLHSRHPIDRVHRILIYKLDHLGDVLLATPALRAIRKRFPEADISIVVGEWSRSILEHNPNIDRIVIYNSGRFARAGYAHHTLGDLKRKLGDWKPDLVIGLRDDWRTAASSLFSGVRRIQRGGVHLREWWNLKRNGIPHSHETDRLWKILRPLGIEPEPVERLDYFVSDQERRDAIEFIGANGIRDPFAVIHAGASTPLKEWPIERFAAVARDIARERGLQLLLIGSPEEIGHSARLASMIGDLGPIDISGRLGLRSTAALLEHASLYLGADGGMMHIAAALGIPTVGLFGPGSYEIFHPVGEGVAAISKHFPCSPCYMVECIRPDDPCMKAITVEEVILETARIIDGGTKGEEERVETGDKSKAG
jgi:ADP-heptose:LPS heptosyltransferase